MTADLHLGPPAWTPALPSDDRSALMVAEPRRPGPDDLVLALDVGGTKLASGVVAGDGRVLAQLTIEARKWEGPEPMIERLIALGGTRWTRPASSGPISARSASLAEARLTR